MADTYITKINNTAIAASQVVPDSPLAQALAALDMGAFEVVTLGNDGKPDVDDPSPKVIYLTRTDDAGLTDPYTEWICIIDKSTTPTTITWEIIGTTSIDLTGYKTKQTAKTDPSASGNATSFIASITQNENGEITATKSTVPDASTSTKGIVQLADSIGATVSSENNKAATEKAVRDAINALDVTAVTVGADKTISSISEADGKISATPVSIQIAESQVTGLVDDLANKANADNVVTDVNYDTTNKKITKTIGSTTSDVVTISTIKSDLNLTKSDVGLGNVNNTSITVNATNGVTDNTNNITYKYTHPTHTAYSSKGTATKVPQITTDSLGHVTGITEVDITGVTPAAHTHTVSDITDFPTLGTAAYKDVPSTGDATTAQVVMGNDSRLTDARTPKSHTHGNITNTGTITATGVTIENGDSLVIVDSGSSSKVAKTTITFDGSTTTKALTQKGTFETIVTDVSTKADKVTGATNGNFAGLDGNGNLTDSGVTSGDFATSAQGAKADSAIQGVKVNGTALTPDNNKYVNISAATTAAYGVVILTTQSI